MQSFDSAPKFPQNDKHQPEILLFFGENLDLGGQLYPCHPGCKGLNYQTTIHANDAQKQVT